MDDISISIFGGVSHFDTISTFKISFDYQLLRTSIEELLNICQGHQMFYLQSFDHGNDLHQGKLLLTGVIVSRGPLILLRCAGAVLVTEFIRGMNQLPRVLKETKRATNRSKQQTINGKTTNSFIPKPHILTAAQTFSQPTHKHSQSPAFTHNFHDVRAPLGQQLQTPQSEVEQLSVFLVGLLAVQARARHHFAVAVARQLRDETDVVLPDLHHLLAQVVLWRDAALGARPPGHKMGKMEGWWWAGADGTVIKNCWLCLGLRAFL